jgi:hypothetical protein
MLPIVGAGARVTQPIAIIAAIVLCAFPMFGNEFESGLKLTARRAGDTIPDAY